MSWIIAKLTAFLSETKQKKPHFAGGSLSACSLLTMRCGKVEKQTTACFNFSTSSIITALLAFSLLGFPAFASTSAPFEAKNTPIADFAAWFSVETGQTVVLGHGVTGEVSFTAPDLSNEDYPAFFLSVLRAHGYELVHDYGTYTIIVDSNKVETIEPSFVKLYKLTHVRNTKVVDLISSMLSATKTQTLNGKGVDNYNVETLPTTNSLIVTGSQSQLEKIDALIEGIDQLQRQIFIEAIITESELGDSQEVGVNMELALGEAGFISQPGTIKKAVDNVLFYEGGDFNALIKAVTKNQNTKLLSRPNMFIMDRERGYITVGQNVPFLTSSEVTDGGNRIQQIERKDVGVSLEVVPHVMGNHVVLQITQKSDSVTDSSIASDIITNTRTLQTVVKVLDGQTISLGGLISQEQRETVSGVPVLMDVPLLGALFRSEKTNTVDKELKVTIRTTIL
ncbi:type II secretory pathway protein [Vibrio parahaemolyticus]|uniref:secretin N-terminal domain-containing protein n=1 Tax=Vibrio harveyi group TaxID=717610 RepID=UPI0013031E77|nr:MULTISPECIES: secretin N-terminal domain-containing protein [Vibrio harveyi group]EGQ7708937.1 type II secretory pathway protein [Vibrio parahaemolyticus]EGQ7771301.1 type II secretory pathway protein [Vibrio parahaemolyticus]EGQ7801870.1 type II secretory pathway protein [Vibrio parahaemolyticus]EGQ7860491.1 type II secretory pathway protein [Vibrio parahaemolyticus]EGQ7887636.1 type II secretory pathway protein [Vibrio parahaemolyticus]